MKYVVRLEPVMGFCHVAALAVGKTAGCFGASADPDRSASVRQDSSRIFRNGRSGGVLLLVLGIMALVLSTTLLASVAFRARAKLTHDALRRESARDTLLLAVSNAVFLLASDTNGVDFLDEPWAHPETFFPAESSFRGVLLDENARLPLAAADTNLVAAVLRQGSDAAPAQCLRYAEDLLRWRDDWKAEHEDAQPPSFAFYAEAGAANPVFVSRLRIGATPYGCGPVNVNTAPPELLEAVLVAAGADEGVALEMASRAVAARAVGVVVPTVTRTSLSALFLGEGVLASSAEANVLSRAERVFDASSDCFRGRFECVQPHVALEFVYDRGEKRFRHWTEE